jgi:chromosomal replication initiation ATPase DnaA
VKKEDIYSTIDKRILGNEQFADSIMDKCEAAIEPGRREKEYTLPEIAAAVEKARGISLEQLKGKGKDRHITLGRKLLSLVAHEYSYTGKGIADYMRKDAALITRHLKEKELLKQDVERVVETLKRINVNSQV